MIRALLISLTIVVGTANAGDFDAYGGAVAKMKEARRGKPRPVRALAGFRQRDMQSAKRFASRCRRLAGRVIDEPTRTLCLDIRFNDLPAAAMRPSNSCGPRFAAVAIAPTDVEALRWLERFFRKFPGSEPRRSLNRFWQLDDSYLALRLEAHRKGLVLAAQVGDLMLCKNRAPDSPPPTLAEVAFGLPRASNPVSK